MNINQAFLSPPPKYSACAFWFWNGRLTPARMLWQMDEMKDKGIANAFMHARAYLKTPYMGNSWFQVMDACVRHAKEIGFHPWLYDEYAWPSGTCGSTFAHGMQAPSRVLAKGRQNMAKGLDAEIISGKPDASHRLIAACPLQDGRTMAFYEHVYETAVDYLNPDTIRDFLDSTHEVYKAHYSKEFGSTIPGIFFDEIFLAAWPLPWTDRLPQAFEEAYGYDLLTHLPALMQGEDEIAQKVRSDYYGLLAALYEQAFFRQIGDWCAQNGLQLTGHTEEDLCNHPRRQGNYFRTMRHLHIPGADCHDYRYRFPREISMHEPKYAVSVARLYGKPRAMSEAMGGAGWGCSLQEYKRGVNALGAAGINMFILHGFYNECEHQGSQADWPASFFYQNPYWKYFKHFADYIHRVSYMNSQGKAVVDAGLYYPIKEIYVHTVSGSPDSTAMTIDRQYHEVLNAFLQQQIDIDYFDEDSLLSAQVTDGCLCTGSQKFKLLIFPSSVHLTASMQEILKRFTSQGGMVLFYAAEAGTLPDGFAQADICPANEMPARYRANYTPDIEITEGSREKLHVNHRIIDGQDVYMLASTLPKPRHLCVSLRGQGGVQKLSPETGNAIPLACTQTGGRITVSLDLEADEACWLQTGYKADSIPPVKAITQTIPVDGKWSFLPLDKTFNAKWSADVKESILSVPLAQFTDIQTESSASIRIRNTREEAGRCGRHISLWKANWLGRRVGWGDDADKHDLYFIKAIEIGSDVLSARVCIAAITHFTLYINGQTVTRQSSNGNPCTLDITQHLRKGRNLLAVHAHTDTPLASRELTQAKAIPPEALASLLLQGEIRTDDETITLLSDASWAAAAEASPDWMHMEPSMIKTIDPKAVTCHVDHGLKDTDFVYAWERGNPPMLPWGDLPLFDTLPHYPRDVRYTLTLPAGTVRVEAPSVAGTLTARLDGKPVSFADGFAPVSVNSKPHTLTLEVSAASSDDGLLDAVKVHLLPRAVSPGDWYRRGLDWFSGRALYQKTVTMKKDPGSQYLLDLGQVCHYAEVWVNGELRGTRVWAPYRVDITDTLKNGENRIAVIVANSAACERRHMLVDEGMALAWNRYWNEDNIDREPDNLVSGLLGPVQIIESR